jgi:hypothetical protein
MRLPESLPKASRLGLKALRASPLQHLNYVAR